MSEPSSSWARTRGPAQKRWRLVEAADRFELTLDGRTRSFVGAEIADLSVRNRWFRRTLHLAPGTHLYGLGREHALSLSTALKRSSARQGAADGLAAATRWHGEVSRVIDAAKKAGRWVPEETLQQLELTRPQVDTSKWFLGAGGEALRASLSDAESQAVKFLGIDLRTRVAQRNEEILQSELKTRREFFDKVERSPLTEEQARAVVCFDNRVQVIAAAGSGKTSVMVARAIYAIERGFIAPDRILLLAFNRDAAAELRERVQARLAARGLDGQGIKATTFHSFGLEVIAQASGRKPRPAPWLEGAQDVGMVARIVDDLRDSSLDFRFKWDLFRLLYARASDEPTGGEPDHWNRELRRTGFRTANNDTVKSEGERIIADFLYYNGVTYEYEQKYAHDVTTAERSQYRPDFYYPQVDVWHEHWAIGRDGKPPAEFTNYAESMKWKQELHRAYGTTLVETTWAEIIGYSGLERLGQELTSLGLELDWNPDRPSRGAKPLEHKDLARLVRTFMTHVKSSSLTRESLAERVANGPDTFRSPRTRLFLDLYWGIHDEWQSRLATQEFVDFEDMMVRAADDLEAGEWISPYELVMVDEFQDASQARARMTHALVRDPGRYLLAVGDDWQSINRFAGADLSVMTSFEAWFGRGPTLRLQTTFRCPQSISDVASSFVAKNPRQLNKQVASAHGDGGAPVTVIRVASREGITAAIETYLTGLASRVRAGDVKAGDEGLVRVDVLGRYRFEKNLMPKSVPEELSVSFRTAHGSKGLEADCIVVPNLTTGTYGFPSQIVDDPVLDIAMSDPDDYAHAEERRLFYVALTRARREVVLVTVIGQESPFVVELIDDGLVQLEGAEFEAPPRVCPTCGSGLLVPRSGPYSEFLGCSNFPRCRHTQKQP